MATERIQIIVSETGSRIAANAIAQIGQSSAAAGRAVGLFQASLAALTAGFGARDLINYSDTFTNMQNRLQIVTKTSEELRNVTDQLFRTANQTRTGFESNVIVYSRLAQATQALGVSQGELLRVTESINKTIAISGANSTEAKNALVQFTQGIASGTLRGDELRSVLEQLPGLAQQIAKGMGVAYGELRTLAREGALTPQAIFAAIQKQQSEIDALFAKTTPTISQSFVILENNLIKFIGQSGQASAAGKLLSDSILFVANNINILANAVLLISGLFAARFIAAALIPAGAALLVFLGNLGAAIRLMISTGSVLGVLQASFLGLSSASSLAAVAMAGLRGALLFFTTTPIGLAITGLAAAVAFLTLGTGSAQAASRGYAEELNSLRVASGQTAAEQAVLTRETNAATEAFKKQEEARKRSRLGEVKKDIKSFEAEGVGALQNAALGSRRDKGTSDELIRISKLLTGTSEDAFKAAAALDELAKAGKFNQGYADDLIKLSVELGRAKQVAAEYQEQLRQASIGPSFGTSEAAVAARAFAAELANTSKEARTYADQLIQLDGASRLTGDALAKPGEALKTLRDQAAGSPEALKLINEQFEKLSESASKTSVAAEALRILDTSLAKSGDAAKLLQNDVVSAIDKIAQSNLVLNGSTEVQAEVEKLKTKFVEGKITAGELLAALRGLDGVGPAFETSGIAEIIGKLLALIGVINKTRAALDGLSGDGKPGGGRIVEGQDERVAERQRIVNNNFLGEQTRLATRTKSQKEFEERRKSLQSEATSRGATVGSGELDRLTRSVLTGEDAQSGGGGRGKKGGGGGGKSEADKEVAAYKKALTDIKGPIEEVARSQAALNKLQSEGSITAEEYASANNKLKLKLLEVREDGIAGLQRAQIKFQQEQANSAKAVEAAYTEIKKPAEDYANKLAAINLLLKENAITSAEAAVATDKNRLAFLNTQTTPEAGFERGLLKIKETATDSASAVESALTNAFKGAEDAFVNFVKTGKLDFKSLADSIIADVARIAFRQAVSGIFNAIGGSGSSGSGSGSGLAGLFSGLFSSASSGASTGASSAFSGVNALTTGASFATGGDFTVPGSGGVDASLVSFRATPGEKVSIERPGMDGGMGGKGGPQVNFYISTPNADSFRASQAQISNSALRAIKMGARNS